MRSRFAAARLGRLLALAGLVSTFAACSGQHLKDPDGDGDRNTARPFSKLGPTEDRLSPRIGDKEDWRFVLPDRDGDMEMRISVGKWKESTLVGFVTVLTEVGDRIEEKALPEGSGTLKFKFKVTMSTRYLVRFRATKGEGEYAVEVDWGENLCASCSPDQECVEDRCVAKKVEAEKPKERTHTTSTPKPRPPPKSSGIACTIIDARAAGSGSVLILSAGDNKGVKVGMSGTIKGLKGGNFTINAVYPSRSKAKCSLPPTKIYGNPNAVIED
jgi:hypothetical protein